MVHWTPSARDSQPSNHAAFQQYLKQSLAKTLEPFQQPHSNDQQINKMDRKRFIKGPFYPKHHCTKFNTIYDEKKKKIQYPCPQAVAQLVRTSMWEREREF